MHSKNCACKTMLKDNQGKFRRHHTSTCKQFKEFLSDMADLRTEFGLSTLNSLVNATQDDEVKDTELAGVLDSIGDDEDDILMLGEEIEQKVGNILPVNPSQEDLTMCCCKKNMPHDETMKFIIKKRSDEDLNQTLFKYSKDGSLKEVDDKIVQGIQSKLDKN